MPAFFPARLAPRQLLLSQTLAYGVGLALPALVGIIFAAVYGKYWALALPIPFAMALGIAASFRPRGFLVDAQRVAVMRTVGPIAWRLADIAILRAPPVWAPTKPIALMATRGLFGTYGWFWNRDWGAHRIYMTDPDEAVEIVLTSGRHIVVTPASHREFIAAVREGAKSAGIEIQVER
ncbi:MAG: hypothetical protein WD044_01805 [Dongiaceae bacterium]